MIGSAILPDEIVIKKKKNIVKILDDKYSDNNLESLYLDYDLNIESRFKDDLDISSHSFNLDIINRLPEILFKEKEPKSKKEPKTKKEPKPKKEHKNDSEINILLNNNDNDVSEEIDRDELEEQIIGEKKYYIDENKGNIYDIHMNLIGFIDEFGELQIGDT